jgi:HD-GYP domain-containing protein (c-di-GMP phosphodiesterase class II)
VKALLQESRFTALRLYGRNHDRLLEARKAPDPGVDQALGDFPQVFPKPRSYQHSTLRIHGRFYVRVLVPLMDSGQRVYGYMEAIYLVPPRTVKNLETRVGATLVTVLIVTTLTSLVLYPIIVSLNRGTVQLSQQLLESVVELMRVLGSAVAKRDGDTDSHNYRVTLYAAHFAETMGRSSDEIAPLIAGAFLHDVGKIGISDAILLKQDKLTSEEFQIMQRHVPLGEEIISDSRWLARAREVVASHHEWFDGSGYPKGLKGLEIPYNARLFAIVDVFDALNSRRPYKAPLALEQTLGIMREDSGRHFDPEMLGLFFGMAPDLYRRFNGADIQVLKLELAASVSKYFPI